MKSSSFFKSRKLLFAFLGFAAVSVFALLGLYAYRSFSPAFGGEGGGNNRIPAGKIKEAFDLIASIKRGDEPAVTRGAQLPRADLSGIKGRQLDFTDADINHAILTDSDCSKWIFDNADMRRVKALDVSFREASFVGTDCRGIKAKDSDFEKASFKGARFNENSDLRGANLRYTDFSEAQGLDKANLTGAVYLPHYTKFPEGFDPAERGMRVDLQDTDFRNMDLSSIGQRYGGGGGVYKMEPRSLKGSNVQGADMREMDLRALDLSEVKNLEEANLENAVYNIETKFPEGFNPAEHGMRIEFDGDSDLAKMDWEDIPFERAIFRNIKFDGVDFSGRNMAGAEFNSVRFTGETNFEETNLEDAVFKDSVFLLTIRDNKVLFDESNLRGTSFQNVRIDISRIDPRNIYNTNGRLLFRHAELQGADLSGISPVADSYISEGKVTLELVNAEYDSKTIWPVKNGKFERFGDPVKVED